MSAQDLDLLRIAGPLRAVVLDPDGRVDVIDDPSPRYPVVAGLSLSPACVDAMLAISAACSEYDLTFVELLDRAKLALEASSKAAGR